MGVGVLPTYLSVKPHICAWYVPGGQKRALDPLKLELQTIVSHHVGAGK